MDPASRQALWAILLASKAQRALLLTTCAPCSGLLCWLLRVAGEGLHCSAARCLFSTATKRTRGDAAVWYGLCVGILWLALAS